MTSKFFCLMILGFLCSGCLKLEKQVTSPGARGVVLEAQTRLPLGGANVVVPRLCNWNTNPPAISDGLTNTRPPMVTTGKNGRFRVPAELHRELIVDYLIRPYKAPGGTLIVQRAGYQPPGANFLDTFGVVIVARCARSVDYTLSEDALNR